jgi:GxxExxY protein
MSVQDSNFLHSEITGKIIQAFYKVYNQLGQGFSKKIYLQSLDHELVKSGLAVEINKSVDIYYDQVDVGTVTADIVVEHLIVLSIHTDHQLLNDHGQILYNTLRSSIYEVGLVLNFGQEPEHQRKLCTSDRKPNLS